MRKEDAALNAVAVRLALSTKPLLFVVVDTEEEFDWHGPFSRANTSVRSARHVERAQRILEKYQIRPTYVVDFPIAHQPDGYGPIKAIHDSGGCSVGAHLHPWVTPPFDEAVTGTNSFACNLGPSLERAKIETLLQEIGDHLDVQPRIYKAGRYGFGFSTVTVLDSLEFEVDMSINPSSDYSAQGGPNFEDFDAAPFFFGPKRRLLEIPCTGGYAGIAGTFGPAVHRYASRPLLRGAHVVGVLARLGIVNKVMLSPEGYSAAELQLLTRALMAQGVRTFSLTFHSPSLEPGHTPYVQTTGDLNRFFDRITSYCDFFFGSLSGETTIPHLFRTRVGREVSGPSTAPTPRE